MKEFFFDPKMSEAQFKAEFHAALYGAPEPAPAVEPSPAESDRPVVYLRERWAAFLGHDLAELEAIWERRRREGDKNAPA
jgi:hypothetical protein